jgi:5-methylthioadenosine/S-adenosylhomocysteine deaminase
VVRRLLVRGRWVVADPAGAPGAAVADGAVLVEGERVAAVGTFAELATRAPGAEVVGDGSGLVIPGLVNTHHHGRGLTSFQLGLEDDYLEPWLAGWRALKPLDAYVDTVYSAMRLIQSGVTTVLHSGVARDMARYVEDTAAHLRAYDEVGMRVSYGVHVLDQHFFTHQDDGEFLAALPADLSGEIEALSAELAAPTADDFAALLTAQAARYADHPRIKLLASPIGPDWCSDGLLRRVADCVGEVGGGIHMHCLESPFQRAWALDGPGGGAVQRLHGLGLLGPAVSLGHAVWLTREQAALCADSGTSVCHNASSNLRLRVGVMPLGELVDAGVNVAIGTDGITLDDDEDMLRELRLVAKLHGLPRGLERAWRPSADDVLGMATANGGRPTLWGDAIGRLTPGALADVVLVDAERMRGVYADPATRPVDLLLARGQRRHVDTVVIGGRVVYRGGGFTGLDTGVIAARLRELAEAELDPLGARWAAAMRRIQPHVEAYYAARPPLSLQSSYVVNSP